MRIKIIKNIQDIDDLDPEERHAYLLYPATTADLCTILDRSPRLETLTTPPDVFEAMPQDARTLLMMRGVYPIVGTLSGRRDFDGRFTLSYSTIEEVRSMRMRGQPSKRIVSMAEKRLNLPPGMTQYLLRAR